MEWIYAYEVQASLAQDAPQAYHFRTEWWGDNDTLADELWDNLDISPVAVALSDEWASQHGVKISESRFPWDDAKGLYFVKVFHQLHCLVSGEQLASLRDLADMRLMV